MPDHPPEPPRQHDASPDTRVFVAGDGVAGLSTGLALHERGIDATVYGSARSDSPTPTDTDGSTAAVDGVVVDPSIRRILAEHTECEADELTTTATEYRYLTPDGNVEAAFDAAMELTADDTLQARLRGALPADRYRPATTIEQWGRHSSTDSAGSAVRVVDSAADRQHGSLLVAADGWLSVIRQRALPSVTPTYAGYVAWQGTVHEADVPRNLVDQFADALSVSRGDNDLLAGMVLPGPDGSSQPGQRRLHWVWYTPVAARELGSVLTDRNGTNRDEAVPPGLLQDGYATDLRERAADHAPPFTRLVRATPDPGVEPVVDVSVPRAVVARTVLVGDAAFTPRHHTAASTPKSIQDATTLAAALDRYDDVGDALADWSTTQEHRGRQLVEAGRRTDLDRLVGRV